MIRVAGWVEALWKPSLPLLPTPSNSTVLVTLSHNRYRDELTIISAQCPQWQAKARLAQMNSREIIKRLKQDGWLLHHVRGDHYQFKHPQKPGKVTVPHPKKYFPVGTLRSIWQQAGWEWR